MRDLPLYTSALIPFLAQTATEQATWERLGIAGASTGIMIYLWRYFIGREAIRAADDAADRNRLLEKQNELQTQVVELLKEQIVQANSTAQALVESQKAIIRSHREVEVVNQVHAVIDEKH